MLTTSILKKAKYISLHTSFQTSNGMVFSLVLQRRSLNVSTLSSGIAASSQIIRHQAMTLLISLPIWADSSSSSVVDIGTYIGNQALMFPSLHHMCVQELQFATSFYSIQSFNILWAGQTLNYKSQGLLHLLHSKNVHQPLGQIYHIIHFHHISYHLHHMNYSQPTWLAGSGRLVEQSVH